MKKKHALRLYQEYYIITKPQKETTNISVFTQNSKIVVSNILVQAYGVQEM